MSKFDPNKPPFPLTRKSFQQQIKNRAKRGLKFMTEWKKKKATVGLKKMLEKGEITKNEYQQIIRIIEEKKN